MRGDIFDSPPSPHLNLKSRHHEAGKVFHDDHHDGDGRSNECHLHGCAHSHGVSHGRSRICHREILCEHEYGHDQNDLTCEEYAPHLQSVCSGELAPFLHLQAPSLSLIHI